MTNSTASWVTFRKSYRFPSITRVRTRCVSLTCLALRLCVLMSSSLASSSLSKVIAWRIVSCFSKSSTSIKMACLMRWSLKCYSTWCPKTPMANLLRDPWCRTMLNRKTWETTCKVATIPTISALLTTTRCFSYPNSLARSATSLRCVGEARRLAERISLRMLSRHSNVNRQTLASRHVSL